MKDLMVLDQSTGKHVDVFHLLLLLKDQFSVLPEIYEIFGDQAIKLIDLFSGMNIKIPSADDLKEATRDVDIYITLDHTNDPVLSTNDLASRYGITDAEVGKIYRTVRNYIIMNYHSSGIVGAKR